MDTPGRGLTNHELRAKVWLARLLYFHHFLALLKKLPGLVNLGIILQKTYDEKVTACVGGESGVPGESTDCIGEPAIQLTADSSVSKDERSAISTQQEDNGRSGESSNKVNSADHVKAIDDTPKLHQLEYLKQRSLIIKTIDRVAAQWKRVALHLHFEDHCINVIEMNCHYQPVPACHAMFSQWLQGNGREPRTWRTLIVALEEANLHTIAQELQSIFPAEFSTVGSNQTVQDSSPAAQAGCKRSAHMEQSPQTFPRIDQQTSALTECSLPLVYLNQFNSPPFNTGHSFPTHPGGISLSPFTPSPNQWTHSSPLHHSLPGPSRTPFQVRGSLGNDSIQKQLAAFPQLPTTSSNAEHPCLRGNNIGIAGAQVLADYLKHYTNLQKLDLNNNKLSDAGAQALAKGLQYCTNLQKLILNKNNVSDTGAQALAEGLKHCTELQHLDLDRNSIGDAGAQALAKGLQHCTNLQTLYLQKNNISDAGAQALAKGLQYCTNLQRLDLQENNTGDVGAQALVEGLQRSTNFGQMSWFSLSSNSLTDSSVGSLSQLIKTAKQLKTLFLYSNKFTGDGMRALRAAAEERNSNPDFVKLDLTIW